MSVRPAGLLDAPAIAAIQQECWQQLYGPVWPALAELLEGGPVAGTWGEAIAMADASPESPYHVLVALDATERVVGFTALAPSFDADSEPGSSELTALFVSPDCQRQGHASRLVSAVAAVGRASKVKRLVCWVYDQDYMRQRFLKQLGFGADGSTRTWQTPAGDLINEARWGTRLDLAN